MVDQRYHEQHCLKVVEWKDTVEEGSLVEGMLAEGKVMSEVKDKGMAEQCHMVGQDKAEDSLVEGLADRA